MRRQKRHVSRFGWILDLPDQRDFAFSAPRAILRKLPPNKPNRKVPAGI